MVSVCCYWWSYGHAGKALRASRMLALWSMRVSVKWSARVCAGLALGIILCLGGIFDGLYAIVLVTRTFETSGCG